MDSGPAPKGAHPGMTRAVIVLVIPARALRADPESRSRGARLDSGFARPRRAPAPRNDGALFLQIPLHLFPQPVAEIVPGHAERDVGAEETGFGAAVVAFAFEFDAVEFLAFGKPDHGVRELDLAP